MLKIFRHPAGQEVCKVYNFARGLQGIHLACGMPKRVRHDHFLFNKSTSQCNRKRNYIPATRSSSSLYQPAPYLRIRGAFKNS